MQYLWRDLGERVVQVHISDIPLQNSAHILCLTSLLVKTQSSCQQVNKTIKKLEEVFKPWPWTIRNIEPLTDCSVLHVSNVMEFFYPMSVKAFECFFSILITSSIVSCKKQSTKDGQREEILDKSFCLW